MPLDIDSPGAAPSPVALQRAEVLRALARRLRGLRVLTLAQHADADTWTGPGPQQCYDHLCLHRRVLAAEADRLMAAARRLEQQVPS